MNVTSKDKWNIVLLTLFGRRMAFGFPTVGKLFRFCLYLVGYKLIIHRCEIDQCRCKYVIYWEIVFLIRVKLIGYKSYKTIFFFSPTFKVDKKGSKYIFPLVWDHKKVCLILYYFDKYFWARLWYGTLDLIERTYVV